MSTSSISLTAIAAIQAYTENLLRSLESPALYEKPRNFAPCLLMVVCFRQHRWPGQENTSGATDLGRCNTPIPQQAP